MAKMEHKAPTKSGSEHHVHVHVHHHHGMAKKGEPKKAVEKKHEPMRKEHEKKK